MVVTCDIEFDQNLTGCYFAGQLVSGTIILKCNKVKDVKAILLKISGFAETLWTEKTFASKRIYAGHEDYLSSTTYLMGSENSTKTSIATGVHSYSFACQLPNKCPSSFEGLHGHIRYTVKVSLVRPWKFDQNYKRGFTVLRVTDLNFESPAIRIPSTSEAYRTFCCGPCVTEPLKLELKIPQAGYVPGQKIPVQALIINNTNLAVSEVNFSLVMLVRYTSQNPTHQNIQRIVVSKVKGDSVLRNCTRAIREQLHVPATPPTCTQTCSVIHIAYQVELEVKMNSFHKNQVVHMPVIIGNIPLANNTSGKSVIQRQPTGNNGYAREMPTDLDIEEENGSAPTMDLQTPNMPPPSYEESVHTVRNDINEDEQHAYAPCEFAPLYPVFNISSPTLDEVSKPMGIDNRSFVP